MTGYFRLVLYAEVAQGAADLDQPLTPKRFSKMVDATVATVVTATVVSRGTITSLRWYHGFAGRC